MLKLIKIENYNLIPVNQGWFNGKIYISKSARIAPWQLAILERFISEIISKSNKNKKVRLDFHVIITSDSDNVKFSADVFAFIDEMIVDDQNTFGNPFSALHWSIGNILSMIDKLSNGLLGRMPLAALEDSQPEIIIQGLTESLPGEISPEEKKETIH